MGSYLSRSCRRINEARRTLQVGLGSVKIGLVVGLLRGKIRSYPASLIVLGLFIVYQIYRFSHTHGAGLIILTVFDQFVLALIWHEYRLVGRHLS